MTAPPPALFETLRHRVMLAGCVLWPEHDPAVGAQVELVRGPTTGAGAAVINSAEDTPPAARFNGCKVDGSFHFMDLPDGAYRIDVRHARTDQDGRWRRYAASADVDITETKKARPGGKHLPAFVTLTLIAIAVPPRAATAGRPSR